jgi:cation:H+ antiporter
VWHFVLLIACAGAIYFACEWFVNAVEWLGRRLDVGHLAVGSVLAAVGTALPESVVTLVAVTTGGASGQGIGVGAAMGGPLVLATVAYGVTGAALFLRRRRVLVPAHQGAASSGDSGGPGSEDGRGAGVLAGAGAVRRLMGDQRWFLGVFLVKVALGLVAFAVKPWLGLVFFAAYGVYFWREMRAGDGGHDAAHEGEGGGLAALKIQPRRAEPATWAVVVQTLAALAVIFVASQAFVAQLDAIGPMIGLPAAVTALLLSPIATELPEIMNAVIWVRQGKTTLALANISGAMMIQATVPSGLGLLFTPWRFDATLLWSGLATMIAIGYLLATARTGRLTPARLAAAGLGYAVFAAGLWFTLT